MRRFIAARVAHAAIVVAIVTTVSFFLLRLAPGDPFAYDNASVPASVREKLRADFGADRPLPEQFVRYVGNVARGHLGYSIHHRRLARDILLEVTPRTLALGAASLTLAIIIGTGLGVFSAARHRSVADRALSALSVVVYSIPEFWLALIIQMALGFGLGLPISGMNDALAEYGSRGAYFVDRLEHMVMPVLTLAILLSVVLARYQRAAMIDVLPADYLRTARAKGATERTVLGRHALRNALTPTITMLGLLVPSVLGGIYFIEYVFGWPGLGLTAVDAVRNLDYDVATASVLVSGVLVAVGSLVADVAVAIIDPRVRDG